MNTHTKPPEPSHDLFEITPLEPSLGALVRGIDLGEPLLPDTSDALRAALLTYRVLFFRDQDITREQHIALGRTFGDLEVHPAFSLPEYPEILPLIAPEKKRGQRTQFRETADGNWHADTTFRECPSAASILRAVITPSLGGDTVFANAVDAYEALESEIKERVDSLSAIHDASFLLNFIPEDRHETFKAEHRPVIHPVIRVHPETGEKAIYVNMVFTKRILGVSDAESDDLLRILRDQIKRPEFQVRWKWQPNSIAIWDNRATQHYAVIDYWEQRRMERVTIVGDRPVGPAGDK